MNRVSFAIKTFERPECLDRLLGSLRDYYPDVPVLVADDSRQPRTDLSAYGNVRVLPMAFDSGMSAGRNLMLDCASTPLVLLMDDDFVFTQGTQVERLIEALDGGPYDLVSGFLKIEEDGREQHYEGFMTTDADGLVLWRVEAHNEPIPCEIVLNFFLARVEPLRAIRWYEPLKICEHEEFFWRAKQAGLRVGFHPQVWALHARGRPGDYNRFRNHRINDMRNAALERHGWKGIRWQAV